MDESLLCLYIAPRSERLKKHIEVKHLGLRLACVLCDFTSAESSNLKKHIERIHEKVKYAGEECGKKFLHKSQETCWYHTFKAPQASPFLR